MELEKRKETDIVMWVMSSYDVVTWVTFCLSSMTTRSSTT